ncbi:MAG: DUF3488 and DUF4129 domain-containing transglutaminase family protein [Pyrinomonadaceae bacterium]
MSFEKFFYLISYAVVFCGFLALWVSGSFGVVGSGLFCAVMAWAWAIEGRRFQISERLGTGLIVAALPVYFAAWKLQLFTVPSGATAVADLLGRLILSLTAIKLLQKKSDRDWIFLYLMAFFEVLLAAGLSVSASYLASLLAFMLAAVCAIVAFEIRKTARGVAARIRPVTSALRETRSGAGPSGRSGRILGAAAALIVLIVMLGLPMFFFLPRVGGAGFGGAQNSVSAVSGFSDVVRLGGISRIQQSNEIVMRVRLEAVRDEQPDLYFRGIALDEFDGESWRRSDGGSSRVRLEKGERDLVPVDLTSGRDNLLVQTVYLEPLDTSVLFGLPRIVALQSSLPAIYRDDAGGLTSSRFSERIIYRVFSDRSVPPADRLRADNQKYQASDREYLQLPGSLDPRIAPLAKQVTASAQSRYDKARALERYLQTEFSYTLEPRAGGPDPLASFLFDVRAGHCEYFASAMAIMLRTQGIAARVVNGFHQGDYNDTADVYVVRQKNAHSWVEVYFPGERSWITFDPTPPVGQVAPAQTLGFAGSLRKYMDALETYWIQYFVAYDNQEQRSLMRSVRSGLSEYQARTSSMLSRVQNLMTEWFRDVSGQRGGAAMAAAAGTAAAYLLAASGVLLLSIWAVRRILRSGLWRRLTDRVRRRPAVSVVEFYDRMLRILADKGIVRPPHQTPLEFAFATGRPEAVRLTELYNSVRFGNVELTSEEVEEIERSLDRFAAAVERAMHTESS